MTDVASNQEILEPQEGNAKAAEDVSSSSEEEDVPVAKKRAATKRRTYKPVSTDAMPLCGIYSTLQSKAGLGDLKFTNLPKGFSLDDDDDDEDNDFVIVSAKQRKIARLKEINHNSAVVCINDRTPEKSPKTPKDVRSPSPPPPPMSHFGGGGRQRTPKKTSKMLRQLDATVMNYRIANLPSLNDSSPMTTPGGSSRVIDLESPSSSPGQRRKQITVKIRTRGGMQKFIMQMNEVFARVIETLARVEGVDKSWIKLVKGDDDISEFNTPKDANIRITDILDCVIINPSILPAADESELNITPSIEDMVEIKVQGQDRSSKMNFTLRKDQPLGEIMTKYSQSCGIALDKIKFMFDGDVINANETPEDLDMDEEGVIDVVISS